MSILQMVNVFIDNIGNTLDALLALPGTLFGSS